MREIDNYMTLSEAIEKYEVSANTMKSKLKPSTRNNKQIDDWVDKGLIRKSGKLWIVSRDFMENHLNIRQYTRRD